MKPFYGTLVIAAALCITSKTWADGYGTCYTKNWGTYSCWVFDTPGTKYIGDWGGGTNPVPHRIAVSNVTLDCNGIKICTTNPCPYAVTEPLDGTGKSGIIVDDYTCNLLSNITIRNCHVRGWEAGIYLKHVNGGTIEHNYAEYNMDGLDTNASQFLTVRYNVAAYNGAWNDQKKEYDGEGIDVDDVILSTYDTNWVYNNQSHAISVSSNAQGCALSVFGTQFRGNQSLTVQGNDFFNSAYGRGINIKSTQWSTFKENRVFWNGDGNGKCKLSDGCTSSNVLCRNRDNNFNLLPTDVFVGDEQNLATCP